MGKIRAPHYRIVVADSRTKRDGRSIEEIGKYHPTENPSLIEIDSERAQYWLSVGAQPSEQVMVLLKLSGDWGKFKGDKNAKSTIITKDAKVEFKEDTSKKSVIRPRVEKKAPEPTPAAEEAPVSEDVVADAPVEEAAASVETAEAPATEETATEAVAEDAVAEEVASESVAEETPVEEPAVAEEAPAEEPASEESPAEDKAE